MTTLAFADRVQEYAMNVGQGTVTLLGASAANLRTFASAGLNGRTVPYVILHRTSNQWEIGYGVYTQAGAALTRVAVLSNSLGTTALVPFLSGEVDVWNDLPAAKIVALDADSNNLTLPGGVTTPTTTASTFGVLTASRVTAGPVSLGTGLGTPGSIGTQGPSLGLVVQGISGSTSDLTLMNAGGFTALRVGAGNPPPVTIAGPLTAQAGVTVTGALTATTLAGALAWSNVTGTPTTLAGYGITDAQSATGPVAWTRITGTPTTLAGYGITDAYTKTAADARYVQSVTGTAARIAIGGTATAPTVNIDPAYIGQASITTLGTVATGTWQATPIGAAYGGTGLATYSVGALLYASAATTLTALAIGTAGQVLNVTGGLPTWHTLTAADARYAPIAGPFPWAGVTGRPTTLGGYGITDAVQVGTITAPMVGAGAFPSGTFTFTTGPVIVGPDPGAGPNGTQILRVGGGTNIIDSASTLLTTLDIRNLNASFAGTVLQLVSTVLTSSVALLRAYAGGNSSGFVVRGDGTVLIGADNGALVNIADSVSTRPTLDVRNTNATFAGRVVNIQATAATSSVWPIWVNVPANGGIPFAVRGDGPVIIGNDTGNGLFRLRPAGGDLSVIISSIMGCILLQAQPTGGQAVMVMQHNAAAANNRFLLNLTAPAGSICMFGADASDNLTVQLLRGMQISGGP